MDYNLKQYFAAAKKKDRNACNTISGLFQKGGNGVPANVTLETEWALRGAHNVGLQTTYSGGLSMARTHKKSMDDLIRESMIAIKQEKRRIKMEEDIKSLFYNDNKKEVRMKALEYKLEAFENNTKGQSLNEDESSETHSKLEKANAMIEFLLKENREIRQESKEIKSEVESIKRLLKSMNIANTANNNPGLGSPNNDNNDNNDLYYDDNEEEGTLSHSNTINKRVVHNDGTNNNNDLNYDGD